MKWTRDDNHCYIRHIAKGVKYTYLVGKSKSPNERTQWGHWEGEEDFEQLKYCKSIKEGKRMAEEHNKKIQEKADKLRR